MQPLSITLRGITNSLEDPSVDVWRAVTLPLLRKTLGADGQLQLKIARRGAPPRVRPNKFRQCTFGSRHCLVPGCVTGDWTGPTVRHAKQHDLETQCSQGRHCPWCKNP